MSFVSVNGQPSSKTGQLETCFWSTTPHFPRWAQEMRRLCTAEILTEKYILSPLEKDPTNNIIYYFVVHIILLWRAHMRPGGVLPMCSFFFVSGEARSQVQCSGCFAAQPSSFGNKGHQTGNTNEPSKRGFLGGYFSI